MQNNLEKIFNFFLEIGKLKTTYRYGASENIKGDSSADHSWRLALMCFVIIDELSIKIDKAHTVEIALVHDLAEYITGDIDIMLIKRKEITKEEKYKMEFGAMKKIKKNLPSSIGNKIYSLWHEYEEGRTKEARFVKALDKIEAITHMLGEGHKIFDDVDLIATYADKDVRKFPELKNVLRALKTELKIEYKKGGIEWKKEYNKHI